MAKGLKVSADLVLPLDTVTSTLVVYGGKGMGKTNFGAVLMEEMAHAGLRWAVLDPMGVWWGIRHSADGKGKGVECLILGGPHGDIPIEPTGGAVIADLVGDNRVNVIIDISRKANGEMWSISERTRFVTDYGKQLFKRQGSLLEGRRREPLCQVIDEAARFIPQMIRAGQPEVAMCESAWATIVEEGRNVGLGVVLLTQRSARLNKDVAELADMMMAFRTVGPNSIGAVVDWLGAHVPKEQIKAAVEKVRSLPVGSCMAVSPGWLGIEKVAAIRRRETFDSSATPKAGERAARVQGQGAKPDLAVYAERMKETIERAKADSPAELRKRIRELEQMLAKKPAAVAAAGKTTTVTVRDEAVVRENADLKRKVRDRQMKAEKLAAFVDRALKPVMAKLEETLQEFRSEAPATPSITQAQSMAQSATRAQNPQHTFPAQRVAPVKPAVFDAGGTGDRKLGGVALKIAAVAAGYGEKGIGKKLLATLVGSTMGGTFSARLSEAKTAGAITIQGSTVYATPEGWATYAGKFQVPSTTEEVLALWRPRLHGVALQIFDHLVGLGGELISRAELAEAVGSTLGGTFSARLSEVRSTQLLVEQGSKVAVNRELLFL